MCKDTSEQSRCGKPYGNRRFLEEKREDLRVSCDARHTFSPLPRQPTRPHERVERSARGVDLV